MPILKKLQLFGKLAWYHIIFYTFPTLEEDYYTKLAAVYFELEMYRKAITLFQKSEKSHANRDPSYTKYNLYYLAYSYLNLGNHIEAVRCFEGYRTFNLRDTESDMMLARCYYLLDRRQEALDTYLSYLDKESEPTHLHIECAKLLFELGRINDAHAQLDELVHSDCHPLLREVASGYKCKLDGNLDKACRMLKKVVSAARSCDSGESTLQLEDLYTMLASFQRDCGDRAGTLITLEQAHMEFPYDRWLANDLAVEYAEQNVRLDEGIRLVDEALKYEPDNAIFLDTKGWLLFKKGALKDAKYTIEQSLQLRPDYPEAKKHHKTIAGALT